MTTILLSLAVGVLLLAYIPLVLTIHRRDRARIARKRPINDVLADAYAQGRLSFKQYEHLLDEVHKSMPSMDAPYPTVREEERI